MHLHANARTTPHTRWLLVQRVLRGRWRVVDVARAQGVSRSTVYKWLGRYELEGKAGLAERSSAPRRVWNRTPRGLVRRIEQLRRRRLIGAAIAERLGMALATVRGILRRLGLGRLKYLDPKEPVVRYERERPGDLLHVDVKKLGRFKRPGKRVTRDKGRRNRGAGWEFVHVCVDDASRVAYVEVLPDEKAVTAVGFLRRARRWFTRRGVEVAQVMSDNGSPYVSYAWRDTCDELGMEHIRTRAYRPQTNGKAERFIQTLKREWAYQRPYRSASARAKALGPWLEHYNRRRPHGSLGGRTPYERLRDGL